MWINVVIFAIALIALVLLFSLKALESRGRRIPSLVRLRREGDLFVTERCVHYHRHARRTGEAFLKNSWLWCKETVEEIETSLLSGTHRVTTRLHVYLMNRRTKALGKSEHVSTHLKNVLEYKKETLRSPEKAIDTERKPL